MLAAIRAELTDSELVARISDLLWQRREKRDIGDARTALTSYLTAAKEHEADDQWPHAFRRLRRAHQLARIFRPGSVEYAAVDDYAMDLLGRLGDTHDSFHVEALADLLLETERTPAESAAIAGQAERLARSIDAAEPMRARRYYAVAAKWYRRLKQDDERGPRGPCRWRDVRYGSAHARAHGPRHAAWERRHRLAECKSSG